MALPKEKEISGERTDDLVEAVYEAGLGRVDWSPALPPMKWMGRQEDDGRVQYVGLSPEEGYELLWLDELPMAVAVSQEKRKATVIINPLASRLSEAQVRAGLRYLFDLARRRAYGMGKSGVQVLLRQNLALPFGAREAGWIFAELERIAGRGSDDGDGL